MTSVTPFLDGRSRGEVVQVGILLFSILREISDVSPVLCLSNTWDGAAVRGARVPIVLQIPSGFLLFLP